MPSKPVMKANLTARLNRGGEYVIGLPPLPACASALPQALRDSAQQYLSVRRQGGDALLAAVKLLSEAHKLAAYGEWEVYLEAIGLEESRARAQIRLHEKVEADPTYAEYLRSGWLSEAVARELLPAPPEVQQEVLSRGKPPTLKDVREAKRALTPALEQPTQPTPAPAQQPKPATCIRCGAERTQTRSLTSYQAGLIDAYPDRDVTLCSRCIPELLAAQRAAEQPKIPEAAPADPRFALEARGWSFVPVETPRGWFRLDHPEIGYVRQEPTIEEAIKAATGLQANYDRRAQLKQEEIERSRANRIARGDPAYADASPVLVAPLPRDLALHRPRRPVSADVSAHTDYVAKLESYTTALEQLVIQLRARLEATE